MCGIAAVYGHRNAPLTVRQMLRGLQNRGQESAGIASGDTDYELLLGMGQVEDALPDRNVQALGGPHAIGHTRYSTTGSSTLKNAQPIVLGTQHGRIALVHNGNLTNTYELRELLNEHGVAVGGDTDSELIVHLLAREKGSNFTEVLRKVLVQVEGAYSLLILNQGTLYAIRDPYGIRPLVMGTDDQSIYFSSETCSFKGVQARYLADIQPGELITVNAEGTHRQQLLLPQVESMCLLENVYLGDSTSMMQSSSIASRRMAMGRQLALEAPVPVGSIVVPVPDSGIHSANGFASAAKLDVVGGIVRDRNNSIRSFIQPDPNMRSFLVRTKLSFIADLLEGQSVTLIDDSLIRGNTLKTIVKEVYACGASQVHVRIGSPPVMWPCFYGIDMPSRDDLLAASMSVDEIRQYIGATSLAYLSEIGVKSALKTEKLCMACFNGQYPFPVIPASRRVTAAKP